MKKSVKIAWDFDGIFNDLSKFMYIEGKKHFKKEPATQYADSIITMFNCSKEEEYSFWKKNIIPYASRVIIEPGMIKIINRLHEEGLEQHILSSRIKCYENSIIGKYMRYLFYKVIKDNNIKISEENIHFFSNDDTAKQKAEFLKENNFDYFTDDTVKNVNAASEIDNLEVMTINKKYDYENLDSKVKMFSKAYCLYKHIVTKEKLNIFIMLDNKELENLTNEEKRDYYEKSKIYFKNLKPVPIDKTKTEKGYNLLHIPSKVILNSFYPMEIMNAHNLPDEEGVVYVLNHQNLLDTWLFGHMMALNNKHIHPVFKEELKHTKFSWIYNGIGSLYVNRTNADSGIELIEDASTLVAHNMDVLIFPEGTRNKTEEPLLKFQKGGIKVSKLNNKLLVPSALVYAKDGNKGKIVLNVGEPISYHYSSDINKDVLELEQYTKTLMDEAGFQRRILKQK